MNDYIEMLNFTDMRAVTLTASTVPDLVSPSKHPNAVRGTAVRNGVAKECDCYPWGGATVATAGLVKVATVRGVIDFHYEDSVNAQRMKDGNTDENGKGGFVAGKPANRLVWVTNADGVRIAMKKNADNTHLYIPVTVMGSEGYEYRTLDGRMIDASIVHPFIRVSDEGERQGVSSPIIVRDYRLDRVSMLRVGNRIAEGDKATRFITALRDGDLATARTLYAELA